MTYTIKDVAERAGCSIATVSRFVNGSGPIAVEMRGRIEVAVQALDYRPSEIGRSLKRKATRTIGVLVPSLTNPVFAASVAGVQTRAREAGFGMLIATSEYDPAEEARAVETFLAKGVDAIALTVCDVMSSRALPMIEAAGKPHVLLYNEADRQGRLAASVDNAAAAARMTETILAAGHKRIVFVAGRFQSSDRSRLRYRGFAEALAHAGLVPPAPVEIGFLEDMPDGALAPLFETAEAPTALFCSNDLLALSVIGALRRLGRAVPGDVSVAGFDGIAVGRMVEPTLATVVQPARGMGETAMTLLLAALEMGPAGHAIVLDFEIRPGGTLATAPVPLARQNKSAQRMTRMSRTQETETT